MHVLNHCVAVLFLQVGSLALTHAIVLMTALALFTAMCVLVCHINFPPGHMLYRVVASTDLMLCSS
jgi:hypothetical protein